MISHKYSKIKVESYDSLPLEKVMTFQFGININVITTIIYFQKKLFINYQKK